MPFRIDKKGNKFLLWNIHKKKYVKKEFISKEGAIGFGKNAIRYRKKKNSKDIKNKILPIKKNNK